MDQQLKATATLQNSNSCTKDVYQPKHICCCVYYEVSRGGNQYKTGRKICTRSKITKSNPIETQLGVKIGGEMGLRLVQ